MVHGQGSIGIASTGSIGAKSLDDQGETIATSNSASLLEVQQTKQQVQEDQMLNLLKPGKCLSMCNAGALDAARVGVCCLRVTWAVTCQRQENSKSEEDFESQTSRAVAHSASFPNCLHRVFHRPFHPVFASCVAMCFSPNSVLLGVLNAFLRCPPWCWMVCLPSRGSCLPLSPIVPLLVSLCWMVCPPSRGSCLPLSPIKKWRNGCSGEYMFIVQLLCFSVGVQCFNFMVAVDVF